MDQLFDRILGFNLLASTAVFYLAARIYVFPRLDEWGFQKTITPILLLHSFRHLGLMFLTRGATYPGLPKEFALTAATGDLLATVLALASLGAVIKNLKVARSLVWIFNVWGTLDLLTAITLATIYDAAPHMGPAYWIPSFWVPVMLVTHYIGFLALMRRTSPTS